MRSVRCVSGWYLWVFPDESLAERVKLLALRLGQIKESDHA